MGFLSTIWELFIEKKCYVCQKSWHFFCDMCFSKIAKKSPYCFVCKEKSKDFKIHSRCLKFCPLTEIIVLYSFSDQAVKKALHDGKYYGKYTVYNDLIVWSENDAFKDINFSQSLLIPIPMHFLRRWKRGYNHSEKIAAYLSEHLDIPYHSNILKKGKYSRQQSKLRKSERLTNIQWSFRVYKSNTEKVKTIYLVDDVVSTWTTLFEAVSLLQEAWFSDVRAIVLSSN